jgi:hypothetical protein
MISLEENPTRLFQLSAICDACVTLPKYDVNKPMVEEARLSPGLMTLNLNQTSCIIRNLVVCKTFLNHGVVMNGVHPEG